MLNQFSRTQLLLGAEAIEKLHGSRVAVFGIGTGPFASGFAVFPATTTIESIALAATAISLFMFILVFLG